MLKKSKVVALLAVCVMMFAAVEPACAETWGEWFSNLFGFGSSNPTQNYVPQGGYYKDIKGTVPGREAHHLVPDAISPFTRGKGPAVLMTPEDHKRTASFRNSSGAQKYRNDMSGLIDQRDWNGVWWMIQKDMNQFGGKYDDAMKQAKTEFDWEATKADLDYAIKLLEGLEF